MDGWARIFMRDATILTKRFRFFKYKTVIALEDMHPLGGTQPIPK